jgi:hypothetical protein
MRKIKYLLFLALSVSYLSCDDATDIIQDGEFNEDATFQSVEDMDRFLNGVYSTVSLTNQISFTSIFTDEVGIGSSNAGQNLDLYKFFLTGNDSRAESMWLNCYTTINYANRLLRGSTRFTPADADLPQYNAIVAEAKALRAWGHFQLLCYFAEDMKNDASRGVILMDRVPTFTEELPRNTVGEVFALIESDLEFADLNLVDHTGADAYYYLSHNFLNAFKARMYAYRGNYALAEQYADEVINNSGLTLTAAGSFTNWNAFNNPSTSPSPYRKMWLDSSQGEIIFGLSRIPPGDGAIAGIYYTNSTKLSGQPLHDMGRNLFNLLADQNHDGVISSPTTPTPVVGGDRDIRSRAFIDQTAIVNPAYATVASYKTADQLLIDKYPGKTGSGAALTNDIKVFRLSEMYFVKAEARAAAGDLATVATLLKQIRDVRTYSTPSQPAPAQPLPSYASATEAWADILIERRKELCFEGHRYIDLRRLGGLAGVTVDRYIRDCEENEVPVCTLDITDHRWVLPVPIREIIGNSNIDQNTGY